MDRKPLRISVEDVIEGEKISLDHVPLSLLKDFAREVEQFLRGSEDTATHENLIVKVETGSLVLEPLHQQSDALYRDMAVLEATRDVSSLDPKRAEIVIKWQKKASAAPERQYFICDSDRLLRVTKDTFYFASDHDLWVPVKRKIVGEVQDMGGVRKPNIHLITSRGRLTLAADHKTLANEKTNRLYKRALVSFVAEENIVTGELRGLKLIRFENYSPAIDSDSMRKMSAAGAESWEGIDAVDWVRRHREG